MSTTNEENLGAQAQQGEYLPLFPGATSAFGQPTAFDAGAAAEAAPGTRKASSDEDDLQSVDGHDGAGYRGLDFAFGDSGDAKTARPRDGAPLDAPTAPNATDKLLSTSSLDWSTFRQSVLTHGAVPAPHDTALGSASAQALAAGEHPSSASLGRRDVADDHLPATVTGQTGDSADANALSNSQRKSPNAPIRSRNVYVAALPLSFTETDLTALLSEFGKVKSCRMFNTGARVAEIGRAYGFALFEDSTSAERAVAALDGKPLGNARIQCQLSRNGVVKKPKDVRERVRVTIANIEATSNPNSKNGTPQTNLTASMDGTQLGLLGAQPAAAPTVGTVPTVGAQPSGGGTAPQFNAMGATVPHVGLPGLPQLSQMHQQSPMPYWPPPPQQQQYQQQMPFMMPGAAPAGFQHPYAAMPPYGAPPPSTASAGGAVPVMTPNGVVWMRAA